MYTKLLNIAMVLPGYISIRHEKAYYNVKAQLSIKIYLDINGNIFIGEKKNKKRKPLQHKNIRII